MTVRKVQQAQLKNHPLLTRRVPDTFTRTQTAVDHAGRVGHLSPTSRLTASPAESVTAACRSTDRCREDLSRRHSGRTPTTRRDSHPSMPDGSALLSTPREYCLCC